MNPNPTLPPRYVSVTGVVTPADVALLVELNASMPPGLWLFGGVLSSRKVLFGDTPSERRRYPAAESVDALCAGLMDAGVYAVVHYNTRSSGLALRWELDEIARRIPHAHAVQLNALQPAPEALAGYWQTTNVAPILQINRASLDMRRETDATPMTASALAREIVDFVRGYAGMVSYALLDLSAGTGAPLDIALVRALVMERAEFDALGIGLAVAGGLDASSVRQLAGLPVSCCAESGMRDANDDLDHAKVRAYVAEAIKAVAPTLEIANHPWHEPSPRMIPRSKP